MSSLKNLNDNYRLLVEQQSLKFPLTTKNQNQLVQFEGLKKKQKKSRHRLKHIKAETFDKRIASPSPLQAKVIQQSYFQPPRNSPKEATKTTKHLKLPEIVTTKSRINDLTHFSPKQNC